MSSFDRDSVRRMLDYLHPAGALLEVRALGWNTGRLRGPANAFFDDPARLAAAVAKVASRVDGVFVSLNPLEEIPGARRLGEWGRAGEGQRAGAAQVVSRQNLCISLEPVRPSRSCATDAERSSAMANATRLVSTLTGEGLPPPMVVDTGAAIHVFYAVELEVSDQDLTKRVLVGLDRRFSDSDVVIDTGMFDAAAVVRLAGTVNREGAATVGRPHRMAVVLADPARRSPVSVVQLDRLAVAPGSRENPVARPGSRPGQSPASPATSMRRVVERVAPAGQEDVPAPRRSGGESLLTCAEVANIIGVQPQTLRLWRCRSAEGPPYVRLGKPNTGRVAYRPADVEEWIRARVHRSTSEESAGVATFAPSRRKRE